MCSSGGGAPAGSPGAPAARAILSSADKDFASVSRAHILLNEGSDKALSFVPGTDFRHATPPNQEIYSERPGRTHESAGVSRSAEDRNDAHAQQKEEFVQTLIAFLREKLSLKDFDRWILVALLKSSAISVSIWTLRSSMYWAGRTGEGPDENPGR